MIALGYEGRYIEQEGEKKGDFPINDGGTAAVATDQGIPHQPWLRIACYSQVSVGQDEMEEMEKEEEKEDKGICPILFSDNSNLD